MQTIEHVDHARFNVSPLLDALVVVCGIGWIVLFVLDLASRTDGVMSRAVHADLLIASAAIAICASVARAALYVRQGQLSMRAEFIGLALASEDGQLTEDYARGYLDAAEAVGGARPTAPRQARRGNLSAVRVRD